MRECQTFFSNRPRKAKSAAVIKIIEGIKKLFAPKIKRHKILVAKPIKAG